MEVRNITEAATLKSFLHLSYKNAQFLFFVTVLFNIFMRQTMIFGGYTRIYMNQVYMKRHLKHIIGQNEVSQNLYTVNKRNVGLTLD